MPVKAKISTTSIKNLKPEDKRLNDTEIKGFHARIYASGKINYYLFYRINGKQVNYSLGTHGNITPALARELATIKVGEVTQGVDVQQQKKVARADTERQRSSRFETFLTDKYKPWLHTRNPKTADRIIQTIRAGFPDLLSVSLSDIIAWRIERWRSERKKTGVSASTINHYVNTLKGAMSRAVEWGLIGSHDLNKVKLLKTDNTIIRYLSSGEEERLLKALNSRNEELKQARIRANEFRQQRGYQLLPAINEHRFADHLSPIVLLAMNTGMRRGEILLLRWSDIDFNAGALVVRAGNAKSGQGRYIPLNEKALQTLLDWQSHKASEWVFEGKNGEPLTDIKKGWSKLLEQAEITDFRFHDLRHHFASKLVMAGVDLNTVRELLGHSDIKMTLRYAHLAPEHKANAVALI